MRRIKRFGLLVAVSFCLFGLLSGTTVMKAEAGDYIGDYCWNFTITVDGTQVSGRIQLGISHLGGGHYLCSGIIAVTDPVAFQLATHGNVEFIGDKIIITLSVQGRTYDSSGGYTIGIDMLTIALDPQTLNGTIEGIGVYSDGTELSEGTVSYTTCQ